MNINDNEREGKGRMTKGEVVSKALELFMGHFKTQFMLDLFRYCYGKGYEAGSENCWYTVKDIESAYQQGYDQGERDQLKADVESIQKYQREAEEAYQKGMQDALQNTETTADDSITIEIGDEVTAENRSARFYVTFLTENEVSGIDERGRTYAYAWDEIDGKTGEHLDVVAWMQNDRSFSLE